MEAEALLASSERPKGVLIKYRELLNEFLINNRTLIELEAQMRVLTLEDARESEAWELITKPTLNDVPVNKRILIVLLGTISGMIGSLLVSLGIDKRRDLIYNSDEIARILSIEKSQDLYQSSQTKWYRYINLFASNFSSK